MQVLICITAYSYTLDLIIRIWNSLSKENSDIMTENTNCSVFQQVMKS